MGKTTLNIEEVEHKVSQAGKPYLRIKADGEWYSAFDKGIIDVLSQGVNKSFNCEIREAGDFKNIRKIYKDGEPTSEDEVIRPRSSTGNAGIDKEKSIRAGVAYRFAVDLCTAKIIVPADIHTYARDMLEGMSKLAE